MHTPATIHAERAASAMRTAAQCDAIARRPETPPALARMMRARAADARAFVERGPGPLDAMCASVANRAERTFGAIGEAA